MKTNRRNFIKTTGIGSLGFGFLPALNVFDTTFGDLFPSANLSRKSPESQGVSSQGILDFLTAAKESGLEWHSFMLLRHGHVVAEGWWKPFDAAYKHTLYSLSKSFTSSAIGFLVQEGKITVEDSVISFFKEEAPQYPSENLKAMKIKHLLTMNTGHEKEANVRESKDSWVKTFLAQEVKYEPSTHFLYNTPATYVLGAILHKVTGQKLEDYLAPRLFQPLEITGYDWETSPQGLNTAGYGLRVKTEDIAKFGQFYLQKGSWKGKQLLSETWINEATSKQTTSQAGDNDWSQGYGYQFWRCKPGFYRGDGAYGQFCMVMPDQDAVLVMTCESWDLQKTMNVAYQTLLPALTKDVLTENPTALTALTALNKAISALSLPVVKGATSSNLSSKYSDKMFQVEKNSYGVTQIGFGLFEDAGVLRVNDGMGIKKIGFGWETWKVNKNGVKNMFPVVGRTHMPSKIAATGTWVNSNTLQINLKFVEAIHGDKLLCIFEDDKVTVSFLNSISENSKNVLEKREALVGVLKRGKV
jgi:CubicO group peptidase (beta-lactamase class C family)